MADHLPDEIISEILSPALRVSDAAFSALTVGGTSPFMTFSESSSAYLVVSKAWLRVATPLLYNVTVLRSKAQAQALATTLTTNPALGRFIKKLRVEGGYAISMLKIFQNSPNITDLFLSLVIPSSDNACGLCRGLPLVKPTRVIVDTGAFYYLGVSKPAQKLLDTLEKCIGTWKELVQFEMSSNLGTASIIGKALSQAPNLRTLVVWDPHKYINRVPDYMRTIAANPALKHIQIKPHIEIDPRQPSSRSALYADMKEDERLKVLVDFADDSHILVDSLNPVEEPPSSPFVYPARLAANPVQEDAIWSRVLFFVLQSNQRRGRLSPLLVCKTFVRLGIPHLYANPVLRYAWEAYSFASQLVRQPLLGRHVRSLLLHHSGDMLEKIVALMPELSELHAGHRCEPITWEMFRNLGESAGSCLRSLDGLRINKVKGAVIPDAFTLFPQIRELCWVSATEFRTERKLIPTAAFSMLVDLTVDTFDESFLNVLAHMELPSLRTAAFSATARGGGQFFQKHGAKLQEVTLSDTQIQDSEIVIWRNCPSLTVLGVSCDNKHPVSATCLTTSETHPRLERIVFRTTEYYRLKQGHDRQMNQLMTALRFTASFPALREIEHPCCKWPKTEREILSSHWVKWAESMLERDVQLFGPDGVRWRHRLKFVPKTKR
ncbi:hypothetical protein K438DRAFT_1796665 [Mycena galopus ATCC 62051]|nr:hypothetical protein K438DRAFT_1796665 [Mycena galopus ATCC 62051]